MSYNSNENSFTHKNRVEGEGMDLRPRVCVKNYQQLKKCTTLGLKLIIKKRVNQPSK